MMSRANSSIVRSIIKCEKDRNCGSAPLAIETHRKLFSWNAQLPCDSIRIRAFGSQFESAQIEWIGSNSVVYRNRYSPTLFPLCRFDLSIPNSLIRTYVTKLQTIATLLASFLLSQDVIPQRRTVVSDHVWNWTLQSKRFYSKGETSWIMHW